MRFGVIEPTFHRPTPYALSLVLLLGGLALSTPASAADPLTLKEVLGKAQTEAEAKAVNDLVGKLKGQTRQTPPAVAAPAPSPDSADTSASTQSATSPSTPDAPSTPQGERVASPAPVIPAPAPTPPAVQTSPETAIESAEQKRAPSVDLEVLFAYNSAEITNQAISVLKTLGQALRDASLADDAFLIAGHTDARGGAAFNMDLSQRRAEAVRQFLIGNFGIDATKLVAKGFGLRHLKNAAQPLAAENRRVQVVNLSKDERR
jgi:outer membrane protein OmpA-like peptidoglycan-associated protein